MKFHARNDIIVLRHQKEINMELQHTTVTEIREALTVYSPRGRLDRTKNRSSYGLSLCIDGRITYIQDGREYVSDQSVAILLPKGGTYDIKREKTGSFPVINFDCLEALCDRITVIPLQDSTELLSDYERIARLICFDGNRAQIFSFFYSMLAKLSSDRTPPELKRAVQLIRSDYNDPTLTNARLSAACNLSEVYFRRLFSNHFKTSPKQYVIDVRLQRAKQMLTEGIFNVAQIAESCGFTNPYHFCKVFRQHTGTTPTEYRRKNLIDNI